MADTGEAGGVGDAVNSQAVRVIGEKGVVGCQRETVGIAAVVGVADVDRRLRRQFRLRTEPKRERQKCGRNQPRFHHAAGNGRGTRECLKSERQSA